MVNQIMRKVNETNIKFRANGKSLPQSTPRSPPIYLFCQQGGNRQEVFRPVCQLYYKIARKFMRKRLEAH